jgi:glucokinase
VRILAGDVGGTKTALAIVDLDGKRCRVRRLERYASAEHSGLAEIVDVFLAGERRRPEAAGFGVAGPVAAGRSRITNLGWRLDERALARATGIPRLTLINDFGANALGLLHLGRSGSTSLLPGRADPAGPIALLGAGTGLGQAALVRRGGDAVVVPSEGGHVDLGARSPIEDRLVRFLRGRFGRATRERVLSGSGLVLVYEFLGRVGAAPRSPSVEARLREAPDRAALISTLALARRDPLCRAALALFAAIYGSEAGNLALQYRATGGVYIAGGIAPKILPVLRSPAFRRAFRTKPPMNALLARIPVRVVLDPRLGLYGAAAAARGGRTPRR